MRINRGDFLKELESVLPGLSVREIIEQSSCFIFKDSRVMTYNDEISCSQASSLQIEGAVQAIPLINILRKLQEETIEVIAQLDKLIIKGKNKQAGIRMESEILLPVDSVEPVEKWTKLPTDFSEAVGMIKNCAGRDETQFVMTCIHITPKWIEACDNYQAARYRILTDIKQSVLIRSDSLKPIESLEMNKFSITKNWIHFKNVTGLIFSCRKLVEEYPKLGKLFKVEGEDTTLPKGLKEAIERAEVFSVENAEDNQITVHIKKGKIKIEGQGISGDFWEVKKVKYSGKSLSFTISPELLRELIERHNVCQVSKKCIKMQVGKFTYIASLSKVE